MQRHVTAAVAALLLYGCGGEPVAPSDFNIQGDWGGGTQRRGTLELVTCRVTGEFMTPPNELGWCELVKIGQGERLGLSLTQQGGEVTGTLYWDWADASPRQITGTIDGASVLLHGSWEPSLDGPLASGSKRTFDLNGSLADGTMFGKVTLQDQLRPGEGADSPGTFTLEYRLLNVSRH
jgi:hypothetical protein